MTKSYVKCESYTWDKYTRKEIFNGNWNRRKYIKETNSDKEIKKFIRKDKKYYEER